MYNSANHLLKFTETEMAFYQGQKDRIPDNRGEKEYYDKPQVVQVLSAVE